MFEGDLGTLEGLQHLNVDPSVSPSIAPSRRVPFAIKPKLKSELERLTDIGVLMPVDEPTDWVSNLIIATKESGDLRLCLDPQQLNKALKRERYPLPVIDDVLPDLSRAKVFTKVDARNGYWHMQKDDQLSKLTTFDTPYRRYRWKRLPFGVSVASEIFQKRLNQALDRLDGLLTVHDDVVIYGVGETEEEATADHNAKLKQFLQQCKERGVKLNKKKLKQLCKEISYMGHLVTADGLKPDPGKIDAVCNMPKPKDVKAVWQFWGFVNYLAKFLPRLSETLEPIQQLTCKEVPWQWRHEHDAAFEKVKDLVTQAPLLKYYNPTNELTVQCDASEKGLGAALKPGPEMYLADTLSRAFLPDTDNAQGEFERVNAVRLLPMTDERLEQMRTSTHDDDVLQQLKDFIQTGWPEEEQELLAVIAPYFSFRDELSIYDGLVFKGERLIPKLMRPKMKERLHSSHIGVNGCLRRARECMYWPGMTAQLKEYISQCETCSKYEMRQQRESLMSHEITDRPWEKVGTDLYTIDGQEYLIICCGLFLKLLGNRPSS